MLKVSLDGKDVYIVASIYNREGTRFLLVSLKEYEEYKKAGYPEISTEVKDMVDVKVTTWASRKKI